MPIKARYWIGFAVFDLCVIAMFLVIIFANTVLTWAVAPPRCPVVVSQKSGCNRLAGRAIGILRKAIWRIDLRLL